MIIFSIARWFLMTVGALTCTFFCIVGYYMFKTPEVIHFLSKD